MTQSTHEDTLKPIGSTTRARGGQKRAFPPLSPAQARQAEADCRQHKGMIVKIARRYTWAIGDNISFDDLLQEAHWGMIRARRTYDAKKGVKFLTYAQWWVVHFVQRYVCDSLKTVRTPVHVQLAEGSGSRAKCLSLDAPSGLDSGEPYVNSLVDHEAPDIAAQAQQSITSQRVNDAIDRALSPRSAQIVRQSMRGRSQVDIGRDLGLSHERIRQLKEQAYRHLRPHLLAAGLEDA